MFFPTTDNPFLALTPQQAVAICHRLEKAGAVPLPYSVIAMRMGIAKPAVHGLIARGLRRLDQNGFPTDNLRRQLYAA